MDYDETELKDLHDRIRTLRRVAEELREAGERIPAVERNAQRILGSIDMLERNVCDLFDPVAPWNP